MLGIAGKVRMNLQVMFSFGHANVGWPVKTYIYQFRVDTGCSLEDLPRLIGTDGER